MSKLAKMIKAELTGDIVASRNLKSNYLSVETSVQDFQDYARIFRLGVRLESSKVVDNYSITKCSELSDLVRKDLKRAMIEEVFGEFRPYLIEMRAAIYDRDETRIRTLLAELEEKMFYEGV